MDFISNISIKINIIHGENEKFYCEFMVLRVSNRVAFDNLVRKIMNLLRQSLPIRYKE